ncbi:hypothetical protein C2G38_2154979 [Gigaspora rosea]|uniref:Uncharacterized protein n=1 Tax=Gigaspora rosea TaxID=44941 RepID=A0A397W8F1_9GLOM|nr:hypothetical protein C2G38_2154979 [Gigaspora rosea]
MNPEEKIVDSRTLGESDCKILVEDNDKIIREEKEHTENELAKRTFDIKECHLHFQVDENKIPCRYHKTVELGNVAGRFMDGNCYLNERYSEEQSDLEYSSQSDIKTGKNNDAAVACRMDSCKEKKDGKATYNRDWKSGGGVCHNSKL